MHLRAEAVVCTGATAVSPTSRLFSLCLCPRRQSARCSTPRQAMPWTVTGEGEKLAVGAYFAFFFSLAASLFCMLSRRRRNRAYPAPACSHRAHPARLRAAGGDGRPGTQHRAGQKPSTCRLCRSPAQRRPHRLSTRAPPWRRRARAQRDTRLGKAGGWGQTWRCGRGCVRVG